MQRFTNFATDWWGFAGDTADMFALMHASGDESEIDLIDILCQCDIVQPTDPFLSISGDDPYYRFFVEIYPFPSYAVQLVLCTLELGGRPQIEIDWEQLNATPERILFQLTEKQWHCSGSPRAYEIGRFVTERGRVGIITSIQTELTFTPNDLRWPRGDSSWMERELQTLPDEVGEVFVSWCVKIEALPGERPDPQAFRSPVITVPAQWFHELPGIVHPEIRPWSRMLFLHGSDHHVRLTCPPGTITSLWCYRYEDVTDDGLDRIGGCVKGFTQIQESNRTYENITRVY